MHRPSQKLRALHGATALALLFTLTLPTVVRAEIGPPTEAAASEPEQKQSASQTQKKKRDARRAAAASAESDEAPPPTRSSSRTKRAAAQPASETPPPPTRVARPTKVTPPPAVATTQTPTPAPTASQQMALQQPVATVRPGSKAARNAAPAPAVALPPPPPVAAPVATASAPAAQAAPEAIFKITPLSASNIAVFRRPGALWIVLDQPTSAAAFEITGPKKAQYAAPKRTALGAATAFRVDLPEGLVPTVAKAGLTWTVTLTPSDDPNPAAPDPRVVMFDNKPRLQIESARASAPVTLTDPDTGDTLLVVPTPIETKGFDGAREFAEFELLPAAHGVVVRPISDTVGVTTGADVVAIDAPGGLKLSAVPNQKNPTAVVASALNSEIGPVRVFDMNGWRGTGPKKQLVLRRRELEQLAATKKEPVQRLPTYMELARLHLTYGYGPETLGYLALAVQAEPGIEASPEFRQLRGAAYALAGNIEGTRDDLGLPPVYDPTDLSLFRGYALARNERWEDAYRAFHSGLPLLAAYPDELFRPLAIAAIDAATRQGDTGMAKTLLQKLEEREALRRPTQAAASYFRGQVLANEGDAQGAAVMFRAAALSRDQWFRARGELALVEQGLAAGTMETSEALPRLEKLRLAWRGDDLEIRVLTLLGQQRVAAGQPEDGLSALKIAAQIAAETPKGDEIKQSMTRIFDDLFEAGGADKLTPLRALAIFQDYRDLSPSVAKQDSVIERLADRMVQIDLLDQAADLLAKQIAIKTEPADKARLGARIAGIRLNDSKPDLAIQALDQSNADKLPADLTGERRLLRARALSKLGKADEATAMIKDDNSAAADQLRVDIAWQARRWKAASDALGRLAGPPPSDGGRIDDAKARLVLNRAVALALAEDQTGLQHLRQAWWPSMRDSKDGELFQVLTRSAAEGGLDLETIRAQVAEIDMFKGFLAAYRKPPGGA
jgi:hypothetical protein